MKTEPERPSAAGQEALTRLRDEIERVDRAIIDLIVERVRLAREVGGIKREAGLPLLDPAREAAVIRRAATLARDAQLADDDVRQVFWHIVGLSRRAQLADE
jgi:chorismate mutase